MSSNPAQSMHPYVIKFVGDLRQVGGFLRAHRFLTCRIFRIFQNLHLIHTTTIVVTTSLQSSVIIADKTCISNLERCFDETDRLSNKTLFVSIY